MPDQAELRYAFKPLGRLQHVRCAFPEPCAYSHNAERSAVLLALSVGQSQFHAIRENDAAVGGTTGGDDRIAQKLGATDDHIGNSPLGRVLFYSLQAGTMLILVLAANTSYADFPRLASFHAGDNFMPRQLTNRGHRLVFSNGILFLSAFAILLVVVTGAKVDRLIPLYAIGVFTSFTLSQAGMARHHLREKEPGWRRGFVINGVGAVMTLVVDVVIAITKFTHGAWVIVLLVPLMVVFSQRASVKDWTWPEALVVLGWFSLLKAVLEGSVTPSLTAVVEGVRTGALDFVLLKPADAQFLVSTARFEPWNPGLLPQ